jgi:hypothetical protein
VILALLLGCVTVQERTRHVDGGTVVVPAEVDHDGDGHAAYADGGQDCDDTDPSIYPGAPELCNGVDDDCDARVDAVDDDHLPQSGVAFWRRDQDADGYGIGSPEYACDPPADVVLRGGDCDDTRAWVNPGMPESCHLGDDDCDGLADEADPSLPASQLRPFYRDADGDGWADGGSTPVYACAAPEGFTVLVGDCDDGAADMSPDGHDACTDGRDEDCDGVEPNAFALRLDHRDTAPVVSLSAERGAFTVEMWVVPRDDDAFTPLFRWDGLLLGLQDDEVMAEQGVSGRWRHYDGSGRPQMHIAAAYNPLDDVLNVFVDGAIEIGWVRRSLNLDGRLALGPGAADGAPVVISQFRVRLGHVHVTASPIDPLLLPTDDTVLLWRFDAGEGDTVPDLSGSGLDALVDPEAWVVPECRP